MEVINEFLTQYNKEYDFYTELARITSKIIESEIAKKGIKAIVSFRAKNPSRLKEKIIKKNKEKNYVEINNIREDIKDLAGVRIALYFPPDSDVIDEIVNESFDCISKKILPVNPPLPTKTKRFSGYWATHYLVKLKHTTDAFSRFENSRIEIQVASVLMHAWSEVEHDLSYKPLSGEISPEEKALLDQINGLVLAGEIALEQLHKAINKRTTKSKEIDNKFELTNFLLNYFEENSLKNQKLGNISALNKFLNIIFDSKISTNEIKNLLKYVDTSKGNETISDQLLDIAITSNLSAENFSKNLRNYLGPRTKTSGFEKFVRSWILFEKVINAINRKNSIASRKNYIPDLTILANLGILDDEEISSVKQLKQLRNQLIHGIETPSNELLIESTTRLIRLIEKIIFTIENEDTKKLFLKELNDLKNLS